MNITEFEICLKMLELKRNILGIGNSITIYYNDDKPIAYDFDDGRGLFLSKKYSSMENSSNFPYQYKFTKTIAELEKFEKDLESSAQSMNISKEELIENMKENISELDKMSKVLGTSKENIHAASSYNFPTPKDKKDDEKIHLEEKTTSTNTNEPSNKQKNEDNPNIKQEADLSQKVNDKYSLGDILGVPEGGKLVTVYSSAVENNKNNTRFTFLIKHPDGHYSSCENLQQIGGKNPTNDVFVSNRDGSNVEKTHVNSAFKTADGKYLLTAKYGTMGELDLGISQAAEREATNEQAITEYNLKTHNNYNTHRNVKEALLSYHSEKYRADKRSEEAKDFSTIVDEKGNIKMTLDNIDGDTSTGVQKIDYDLRKDMLMQLYEEKGSMEYFEYDSFEKDFIETYLKGNTEASDTEFESAIKRCESEHSRTQNNHIERGN